MIIPSFPVTPHQFRASFRMFAVALITELLYQPPLISAAASGVLQRRLKQVKKKKKTIELSGKQQHKYF